MFLSRLILYLILVGIVNCMRNRTGNKKIKADSKLNSLKDLWEETTINDGSHGNSNKTDSNKIHYDKCVKEAPIQNMVVHVYEGEDITLSCACPMEKYLPHFIEWGSGSNKMNIQLFGMKRMDTEYEVKRVSRSGNRWYACIFSGSKITGYIRKFWLNVTGM